MIRKDKIIIDVQINNCQITNRPIENKEEIGMRNKYLRECARA